LSVSSALEESLGFEIESAEPAVQLAVHQWGFHMMRRVLAVLSAAFLLSLGGQAMAKEVEVQILKGSQTMNVYVGGKLKHTWKVSTGRNGFNTPKGKFKPTWMTKMWHSKQWHNAPMPHSIFFKDGFAIHGTTEVKNLGRPASHGCVRLAPKHAAKLFDLVKKYGEKKTRIQVAA
jgi:hypothetical protein